MQRDVIESHTLREVVIYTCSVHWVNSALHPSEVAKSSTGFGWGKGGNVTSVGWQVTPYDPIWHVSSRTAVRRVANRYIPFTLTFTILP